VGGSLETAEFLLGTALAAIGGPRDEMREALDALPVAIYVTDVDGRITFYNRACVPLTGRVPETGFDRWCVTWKLFTIDGEPLPHEVCPMAVAIKERREVRGAEALAERPDGSRVRFRPFPTPLFDENGEFTGAINMLIDVTDRRRAEDLRQQAARCRYLTNSVLDRRTIDALSSMASEYDEEADRLSRLN
jgi:PAS domain S-box-containing protein